MVEIPNANTRPNAADETTIWLQATSTTTSASTTGDPGTTQGNSQSPANAHLLQHTSHALAADEALRRKTAESEGGSSMIAEGDGDTSTFNADVGFDQLIPKVSAAYSEKDDLRARLAEFAEKAFHAQAAPPTEYGTARSDSSAGSAAKVQHSAGIADQIKAAVLAEGDSLRRPGRTEIHVQLDPPDLGRVRLHLTTSDERVSGRLVVEAEAVRALIESRLPELRQRLEAAGIELGRFDVARDGTGQSGAGQDPQTPNAPRLPAGWRQGTVPIEPALAAASRARSSTIDLVA
jgi:flagellar hook-length control protein FliK